MSLRYKPIINSILDTDLYKLTMGMAVGKEYPREIVNYHFINRGKTVFPEGFGSELINQIQHMASLSLTDSEASFLTEKCGSFLDPYYIKTLKGFRFDPSQVDVIQKDGDLRIEIIGPWIETIYWEVPLMALISELYFLMERYLIRTENKIATDRIEILDRIVNKGKKLSNAGAKFADFGTRRRHSYNTHDIVVSGLCQKYSGNSCTGTSNVHFAQKYNTTPIGTQAHEWFMYHAAKYGYRMANQMALGRWVDVFGGQLGIALTDTFTTKDFFHHFDLLYAQQFKGVRQDSGDPLVFMEKMIAHYNSLGIDPSTKTIVFSDSLNVEKCLNILEKANNRIMVSFGIGTNFTNDVGYKPLNMVIKLMNVKFQNRWIPTVKFSDDEGKVLGPETEIAYAKYALGL